MVIIQKSILSTFCLQVEDMQVLEAWMIEKTYNYMSPSIHNECLKLIGLNILRMFGKNVWDDAVCFSIMVDECTYIASKEQFIICLRWVGRDLEDRKDIIGLY